MSSDAIGMVVADRYRLIEKIGTGPSATVYLADDVRLRRRVAVKLLDATLATETDFVTRFRAEMAAAAALRHPHVGVVHDWGIAQVPFVVSEYFANGSLRDLLDRGDRLSASQALQVSLAAARALAYAHERGVVHRDVRPTNLLFADDGRLGVVDFGLARAFAEAASTEPMGIGPTGVRYASPEQAKGQNVDGRADVYSLVLTVLEAVTGEPPFAADTALATLMARLDRTPDLPVQLGSLRGPMGRASAIDPDERIDASDLVTALMAVADDFDDAEPLQFQARRARAGDAASQRNEIPDDITLIVAPDAVSIGDEAGDVAVDEAVGSTGGAARDAGTEQVPPKVEPPDVPSEPDLVRARSGSKSDAKPLPPGDGGHGKPEASGQTSEGSKGRRRWRIAWIVLALVVVFGGGAVGVLVFQAQRTPTHLVPQIASSTPAAARARLSALGFRVKTDRVRRDGTVAGQLLDVDPAPGTRIREGDVVTLTVSDGQTLVTVPSSVVGMAAEVAGVRLESAGFALGKADRQYSEDVETGLVIGTVPDVGEDLEKGHEVTLVVSLGPKPRVIPSVSGMTPDAASQALRSVGLVPVVVERYDTAIDRGGLIGVEPGAGTTVERGTSVEVVVSKGLLVSVPGMDGVATVSGAIDKLQQAGLVPGRVRGSGQLTGRPTAFAPGSGQMVPKGSVVDIVVE